MNDVQPTQPAIHTNTTIKNYYPMVFENRGKTLIFLPNGDATIDGSVATREDVGSFLRMLAIAMTAKAIEADPSLKQTIEAMAKRSYIP